MSDTTRRAAEQAARESYGRLVAIVAARTRDIAAAEDALAVAFRLALETWPERGVPRVPEAWLVTVARREAGRALRRGAVRAAAAVALEMLEAERAAPQNQPFPDRRLSLLFACAAPEVEHAARTPLMLQAVLGLDAARIAGVFLTSPAAMSQRLVRAKARLREARARFAIPDADALPSRLYDVLQAIYAAYGLGREAAPGADEGAALRAEALYFARLLAAGLPEPEALGLLALILHGEAREAARHGPGGAYVPLDDQDLTLWNGAMIDEAEALLERAAAAGQPGRFQIEAAIQSVHAMRRQSGQTDWAAIAALYRWLGLVAPSMGAAVAGAAAIGHADGASAGLAALAYLAVPEGYQPYWAVRAHLLAKAGATVDAHAAYERAIGLSEDAAVRDYLLARRTALRRRS